MGGSGGGAGVIVLYTVQQFGHIDTVQHFGQIGCLRVKNQLSSYFLVKALLTEAQQRNESNEALLDFNISSTTHGHTRMRGRFGCLFLIVC